MGNSRSLGEFPVCFGRILLRNCLWQNQAGALREGGILCAKANLGSAPGAGGKHSWAWLLYSQPVLWYEWKVPSIGPRVLILGPAAVKLLGGEGLVEEQALVEAWSLEQA